MEMSAHIAACLWRLQEALIVAERLLSDAHLHRAAMMAVFALEDVYEALVSIGEAKGTGYLSSSAR